jgi:hypothetical protein
MALAWSRAARVAVFVLLAFATCGLMFSRETAAR